MMLMHASTKEINLFTKHTMDSKNYLEFGCGGSTFNMLYLTEANIISVESDLGFAKQIINDLRNFGDRLNIFHIDIGNTKEWGCPIYDSNKASYPLYSSSVFSAIISGGGGQN